VAPLAPAPQIYCRPCPPVTLAVPELDASNAPAIARQIDDSCLLIGGDSVPYFYLVVRAVIEVDDNLVKLNRAVSDSKLQSSERTGVVHANFVMVRSAVYVRLTQKIPSIVVASIITSIITASLTVRDYSEADEERQRDDKSN